MIVVAVHPFFLSSLFSQTSFMPVVYYAIRNPCLLLPSYVCLRACMYVCMYVCMCVLVLYTSRLLRPTPSVFVQLLYFSLLLIFCCQCCLFFTTPLSRCCCFCPVVAFFVFVQFRPLF